MALRDEIKSLREENRRDFELMKQLDAKATTEKRSFTAEEQAQWDTIHTAQEERSATIARKEALLDQEDALNRSDGTIAAGRQAGGGETEEREQPSGETEEGRKIRAKREMRAFDRWLRSGMNGFGPHAMTAEDREIIAGRYADLTTEQRALAAGTDTAGGFTVPDEMQQQIIVALSAYGGIRKARTTKITTSTGADLPFPVSNDTSNKGARIAENTPVSEQDVAFGQKVLKAYDYSSKLVKVSYRLLQDSAIDVPSFLAERLAERLGRIMNEEDTTYTGVSGPMGLVNSATLGKTGASATAITWDEVYDLIYSVNADYREEAEFMFNDDMLKSLKKLKDGQGRYLWQSGVAVKEPDTIDRYPYVINYDMASMASTAKPMLFGAMKHFYLRDVLGVQMIQLRERFADALQVGFMAFMRHDAGLLDAGTHPIKYFQNAA